MIEEPIFALIKGPTIDTWDIWMCGEKNPTCLRWWEITLSAGSRYLE